MRRILHGIFAALGLCSGCSESTVVTPRQFTREFADELRKSSAELKVEMINDLELKVTRPNGKPFDSFLNNAYAMYRQDPKAKAEVIQKFVAAALETVDYPEGVERTSIVPIIKDKPWLEETRKAMVTSGAKDIEDRVYEDFNSDLLIVYAQDSPKNIRYLTPPDLEKAGITRNELKAIASQNLKRLLPNVERRGAEGLYMITAGGDYEASLLVVDSVWTDGQMRVKGDFVVAIPTRDLLLVTGTQEPEGILKIRQLAKAAFEKEFAYRLTPKLFVYREGKFEPFEDRADEPGLDAPIVKVDSTHQMINQPASVKPESYKLPACSTIILDATGYSFDVLSQIGDKPLNSIQVLLSKNRQYEIAWRPGKTRYELSKATLQPWRGSEPFDGFKAGDKMMLSIGIVFAPRKFAPVWSTIVDVE